MSVNSDMDELLDVLIKEAFPLPKPPEAISNEDWRKIYGEGFTDAMDILENREAVPAKWQEVTVDPKGAGHTYRLRVPGGWLYRTTTYRYPEFHKYWEQMTKDEQDEHIVDSYKPAILKIVRMAMEIAQQTTTFVPEA